MRWLLPTEHSPSSYFVILPSWVVGGGGVGPRSAILRGMPQCRTREGGGCEASPTQTCWCLLSCQHKMNQRRGKRNASNVTPTLLYSGNVRVPLVKSLTVLECYINVAVLRQWPYPPCEVSVLARCYTNIAVVRQCPCPPCEVSYCHRKNVTPMWLYSGNVCVPPLWSLLLS